MHRSLHFLSLSLVLYSWTDESILEKKLNLIQPVSESSISSSNFSAEKFENLKDYIRSAARLPQFLAKSKSIYFASPICSQWLIGKFKHRFLKPELETCNLMKAMLQQMSSSDRAHAKILIGFGGNGEGTQTRHLLLQKASLEERKTRLRLDSQGPFLIWQRRQLSTTQREELYQFVFNLSRHETPFDSTLLHHELWSVSAEDRSVAWSHFSYLDLKSAEDCLVGMAKENGWGQSTKTPDIILTGFSNGGIAAHDLARNLAKQGLSTKLLFTMDPVIYPTSQTKQLGRNLSNGSVASIRFLAGPAERVINFFQISDQTAINIKLRRIGIHGSQAQEAQNVENHLVEHIQHGEIAETVKDELREALKQLRTD